MVLYDLALMAGSTTAALAIVVLVVTFAIVVAVVVAVMTVLGMWE